MTEVEAVASSQASAGQPTHRRWVGVVLSLLISGAGIFLSGHRSAGVRWFCGLTLLWVAKVVLTPVPAIPSLYCFAALSLILLSSVCWMLIRSYRVVPRLGIRGWVLFLSVFIALEILEFGVSRLCVHPFKMPTGSMETTLLRRDHIFVQTCAYWFSTPQRGDVVVFKTDVLDNRLVPPGQYYVKRVAALPGERVEIKSGRMLINGQPLAGPPPLTGKDFTTPGGGLFASETNSMTLAEGDFFVVGDNSTNSMDSRHFGPVPRKAIYGKATKIYWPFERSGDIR